MFDVSIYNALTALWINISAFADRGSILHSNDSKCLQESSDQPPFSSSSYQRANQTRT